MATEDDLRAAMQLDRIIHEPARLLIVAILYAEKSGQFPSLLHRTRLTNGNLHTHLQKLEQAGYIQAEVGYRGKKAFKIWRLSEFGQAAFEIYQGKLQRIADYLSDLTDSSDHPA